MKLRKYGLQKCRPYSKMNQTSSSHNTKNFDLLFKIEGQRQRKWQLRQHSKSLIRAKQGNVFVFIRKTIYLPIYEIVSNTYGHNYGHNVLRIFVTLSNYLFTTIETKRDY